MEGALFVQQLRKEKQSTYVAFLHTVCFFKFNWTILYLWKVLYLSNSYGKKNRAHILLFYILYVFFKSNWTILYLWKVLYLSNS